MANRKKANKRQQQQQQQERPKSFPSISAKASAAAPATTSTVSSESLLSADRYDVSQGTQFPASASASSIASNVHVPSSLSHLFAQDRESRTRTPSNASSSHRPSIAIHASPARNLLSNSPRPTSSPFSTALSVSPPSPRKHSYDPNSTFASASLDQDMTSDSIPAPGLAVPALVSSSSSAGAGGALKSLQRVASRDKLKQEQAEQAAARKDTKKKKKQSKHSDQAHDDSDRQAGQSTATANPDTDRQSIKSEAGVVQPAPSAAHQESILHQSSAHAEADRLIEADRVEAEQLEAHVVKHEGDQTAEIENESRQTPQELSAAFHPSYQPRKRDLERIQPASSPIPSQPVKHTQSGSPTTEQIPEDDPPTAIQHDEPDPEGAQRSHDDWHAQLEQDRARIGAAVGDMAKISGSSREKERESSGWRQWKRTDRSAEVGSLLHAGLSGPQLGLVWHGPGLSIPGKVNALANSAKSVLRRITTNRGEAGRESSEDTHQRGQPGPVELVRVRAPLPLLVPHFALEWTTAALGAGVCMEVLGWALGRDA
ncbi:unnamed protein product [Tilletia controversa]|uniref:Uncharacterized protein n=3 Tax=Tilletia TaxID=13289 RepID=A0A8X7MVV9_9BASI|nr:hypothetical protein CF336_g6372 [Tilletia laevis]KAE8190576.1 hypothetical protein CF328_g5932 [Tilletia controversa]KAE8256378.1 hypothetical protein A4X03_0g5409 [Tilletia caries]KAE8192984.1 hypothetical protein CF335_g5705 [Tilletia laevis]KAE8249215.1 hypothetical protein A4X06_0g3333 [Tilletia controversa]